MHAEQPQRRVPRRGPWGRARLVTAAVALAMVLQAHAAEDWPDEAGRLAGVLAISSASTVAEIGAGHGELTIEMARRVPEGRVYSTEIDRERLADIERAVANAGLRNVSVIEGGRVDSHLPEGCCDAVYMREVYHHFDDSRATMATIHRAGDTCHCIAKTALIAQVTAQGFDVIADEDRWSGIRYLVVFRKR